MTTVKHPPKPKKTPRTRKPQNMSVDEWQIALRKEFGREQKFQLTNLGNEPVFSEFSVTNPETKKTYRVAIRGRNPGDNYCSCPDFAVNTLGTCKHVEFTLARLEKKRGAKQAFKQGFQPSFSEVYLRYGGRRDVCFNPGAGCPEELVRYAANFFDSEGVLKPQAISRFHTFLQNAPSNGHELRCYEDALQFIAHLRDDLQRRKRIEKRFPQDIDDKAFHNLLKVQLYPYQKKGALFAAKTGRCLIADDMGLGKTIQAIAAIEILARTVGVERVLIVSPTAVKHQWKQEIERFCKRTVEVVEGLLARRKAAYRRDTFYKITNYDVIHLDEDLIREWSPDVIVLDEAQKIKNWKTRRAQCVKRLSSEYAIVLTGTPLENRLEELHSIVEFVDRFRLGPLFRFLAEHQQTDEAGMVIGYRNLSTISQTLQSILLRRTKNEVLLELPERVDQHLFVPMTDEQWMHHDENRDIVARIVAKWRRMGFLTEKDQRRLMIALQNMRMACNSTYLIDPQTDHGVKADEFVSLAADLLEEPDMKMVVFSQWIGTHQLIVDRLESLNTSYVFYHGSLSGAERNQVIQRFKEDPACRIFLSTDSGGVGLNLQHASVVVNMDQPWNPAVLEQRIGRVHRLGQHRSVRVIHYVSQGTIEHGMLDVLAFKKSVFAGVLDGGENEVLLGGSRLKKFMETVEKVTQDIPDPMPTQEEAPQKEELLAGEPEPAEEISDRQTQPPEQQALDELISTGVSFIQKLGQALTGSPSGASASESPMSSFIAKDEQTGENYIKLPLPQPETLKKITESFDGLMEMIQKWSGK